MRDPLLVLLEPDEQAILGHLKLVLHKVEVVGLLSHVVARIHRVYDLKPHIA